MNELVEALNTGLPDAAEQTQEEHGRWLLAQLLNWHRREAKSTWWRYFYLKNELTDEERRDEPDALGGLSVRTFLGRPGAPHTLDLLPVPLPPAGPRRQGGQLAPRSCDWKRRGDGRAPR